MENMYTYEDHGEHDDDSCEDGELGAANTNNVAEESSNEELPDEIA